MDSISSVAAAAAAEETSQIHPGDCVWVRFIDQDLLQVESGVGGWLLRFWVLV